MSSPHRRYANETEDWPDIQLFLASYADNTDGGVFGKRDNGLTDEYYAAMYEPILYRDSYSVMPLLLRPKSRGRIRLKNANPFEHPLIYPNYFQHPDDIEVLVSMDVVRSEVLTAVTMKTPVFRDVTPCSVVHRHQSFRRTCCLPLQEREKSARDEVFLCFPQAIKIMPL